MGNSECTSVKDLVNFKRTSEFKDDTKWMLKCMDLIDAAYKKFQVIDLEDLMTSTLMMQMGKAIEENNSPFMSLWTTGKCGLKFIEALCNAHIDKNEVSAIRSKMSMSTQKEQNHGKNGKTHKGKGGGKGKGNTTRGKAAVTEESTKVCDCCGSKHHVKKDCPKSDVKCHCCGKQGHFKFMCSCNDCKSKKAGKFAKVSQATAKEADGKDEDEKAKCSTCGKYHSDGQKCAIETKLKKDAVKAYKKEQNSDTDDSDDRGKDRKKHKNTKKLTDDSDLNDAAYLLAKAKASLKAEAKFDRKLAKQREKQARWESDDSAFGYSDTETEVESSDSDESRGSKSSRGSKR